MQVSCNPQTQGGVLNIEHKFLIKNHPSILKECWASPHMVKPVLIFIRLELGSAVTVENQSTQTDKFQDHGQLCMPE